LGSAIPTIYHQRASVYHSPLSERAQPECSSAQLERSVRPPVRLSDPETRTSTYQPVGFRDAPKIRQIPILGDGLVFRVGACECFGDQAFLLSCQTIACSPLSFIWIKMYICILAPLYTRPSSVPPCFPIRRTRHEKCSAIAYWVSSRRPRARQKAKDSMKLPCGCLTMAVLANGISSLFWVHIKMEKIYISCFVVGHILSWSRSTRTPTKPPRLMP
jgi:hypothetical protein